MKAPAHLVTRSGSNAPRPPSVIYVVMLAIVAFAVGTAYANGREGAYDTIGGYVTFAVLLVISMPFVIAAARREPDPRMVRIFKWALFLKLAGGVARYLVVSELYGGFADSAGYHLRGLELSELIRKGIFHADTGPVIGTVFIDIVTGVVYTLIGPTKVGGFIFFSWLGFWGLLLFYRAFCIAMPDADHFRYALLIFFMPSMIFWPSATGKDAWMMMALGLCANGAARIQVRRPFGFWVLALGLLASVMARPHVSVIVMVGLGAAYLLRRAPDNKSPIGPVAKVVGIAVIILLSGVILRQAEDYLKVDSLTNQKTVTELQTNTREQTTQGFSKFETSEKGGLSQLPLGVVTLLFRPFPFEATSAQSLFASLEGVLLIGLFIGSRRRLKNIITVAKRHSYVVLAVVYSLIFIYAFSAVGNFAIVGRQRAQLFPFVFVLLAMPGAARAGKRGATGRRATGRRAGGRPRLVAASPRRQLRR
jgi:hypothetical protein